MHTLRALDSYFTLIFQAFESESKASTTTDDRHETHENEPGGGLCRIGLPLFSPLANTSRQTTTSTQPGSVGRVTNYGTHHFVTDFQIQEIIAV